MEANPDLGEMMDAEAADASETEVAESTVTASTGEPEAPADDAELAERLQRAGEDIRTELKKVIIGQDDVVEQVLMSLFAGGNSLIVGVPGLAKTLLIAALSDVLELSFNRIQFTPDLMPSDITGTDIIQEDAETGRRQLVFVKGPVFANVVLADEINRTPPKTQAALLEAMQEHQVTVMGDTHPLPRPFFVLATQNPIELEGTYPLPEAQLDRFLFKVDVPRVGEDTMAAILKERRRGTPPDLEQRLEARELEEMFDLVDRVFLPEPVATYVARLTAASHADHATCPSQVREYVKHGASPRAAIAMAEAARAAALLAGRPNVDFADIKSVAVAALAHRLVLQHTARLEGITATQVVEALLEHVDPLAKELPKELR